MSSIVTTGYLLVALLDNGPTAPGICAFAVRRDAMRHNPGRDAARRAIGRGLGDYFDRLCDSHRDSVHAWELRSGIGMPAPLGSLWAPWDSNPQPTD